MIHQNFTPKQKELAKQAIKQMDEEKEMLAKMSDEEVEEYWQRWAERVAADMCHPNA
jgi:glycerol kinase